jgi:hypothetical protein
MEVNTTVISDDYMKQILSTAKSYTIVFLKTGNKPDNPNLEKIIWEHGRRNLALRAEGLIQ